MIRQVRIELNYWTIEDITVDYCRSHPPVITGKWKSQWLNVIYICVCIYLLELFVCLFMYLFIFLPIFFLVVILPFKPPKIGFDYRIVLISIYIPNIVGSMPIVSPYARFPLILFLLRIPTPLGPLTLVWYECSMGISKNPLHILYFTQIHELLAIIHRYKLYISPLLTTTIIHY